MSTGNAYAAALTEAMTMLGQHPGCMFLGQAVECPGTAMTQTLSGVPDERKQEFPVAEETQLGVSIGMALAGLIPVTIFPRMNFLILATNQLVNHLDKLPRMGWQPTVIIRVGVGAEWPLHPGPQHVGDYSEGLQAMCESVMFVRLRRPEDVVPAYKRAVRREGATVLVEDMARYHD